MAEVHISDGGYNEFVFYWTAAARGYYPGLHPWDLGQPLGSFPFAIYPTLINHPVDYNPDDPANGGNGDGFIQMGEAFDYSNNWDTWSLDGYFCQYPPYSYIETPQAATTVDFQEDLLSLTGISGIVENTQTISGNFLLSETGIQIIGGVTLSISSRSNLFLGGQSQIIAADLSTLNIGNIVTFMGETTTIPYDPPFVPQTIPGNKIEIYGSIAFGTGVQFTVEDDEYWDGLYMYGNQNVSINDGIFYHCSLYNKNGGLQLAGTDFTESHITNELANLSIDDCDIDGTISGAGIYCYENLQISITDSYIHDSSTGINIFSSSNYVIDNCDVYDNTSYGIYVHDSYMGTNTISLSNIYNNGSDGIRFYTSEGTVESCNIYNNYRGILCFNGSIIEILKDPNTSSWFDDSVITNNDNEEILFFNDCTVMMDGNRNKVVDNTFVTGSTDQYLARCPNMSLNRVFRKNYWGYNDINGIAILPPENRFFPALIDPIPGEIGYMLSQVWQPGTPADGESSLAEALYREADLAVADEEYVFADQLFRQLITLYPETEFAHAAAKRLLEVNSDIELLQTYYESEPNLHCNDEIDKYSVNLANYCNVILENYEDAIYSFEDIIIDPPSEIDSVMAVIDLGYTYLVMEENGDRSGFVGRLAEP